MTLHTAHTVWLKAIRLLVAAILSLAGSLACAQLESAVVADDGLRGWAGDGGMTVGTTDDGQANGGGEESFAVAADGAPDSAAVDDGAPWGTPIPCPPRGPCATWGWRAEALALWRSAPSGRPLFSNVVGTDIAGTALDANQLQSDPLAAPRLSLFRDNNCGQILEVNYLWAGNFYSQRSLPFVENGYATSPPGIFGNQWGPDPDPLLDTSLSSAQATLTANLQTAEVNFRERFWNGLAQFLIGFRWLQWNETLQMQDSYNHGGSTGNDFYNTACFNNLYGGQIGIDAILLSSQSGFRIDGLVKAGAYYNDASQRSAYAYIPAPADFSRAIQVVSPDGAAFVGEVGMTAVFPVHCNLDLRVGYFGLWIENIAQPTNQLSGQTLTQIDPPSGTLTTNGGVLLQGLSLGLEGRW